MLDILLTPDGDLRIDEWGDIALTESVRQAVRIRLLWFFQEWRFAPDFGVPYFEEVFVKNPNITRIRAIIRREVLSVRDVTDVKNIEIDVNSQTRHARITFDALIGEETYREELNVPWATNTA